LPDLAKSLEIQRRAMLQVFKLPPVQEDEGEPSRDFSSAAEPSFGDLITIGIGFIRRQLFVIIAFLPLTVGLALAYLYTTPPLYTAQARLMIDTSKTRVFQQPIFSDDPVTTAMVDSQIEILKSENFGLSIVKDMHLTEDPEFVGSRAGLFDKVMNLLGRHHSSEDGRLTSGAALKALRAFESHLTVSRVGATYAVEIEFQSTDPNRAAQIANAVADAFIVHQLDARYQAVEKATGWLQDRLSELRSQALTAERAVVDYKTKNNIIDSGGKLINEQQLAELNSSLIKARADAVEAQARLDRVTIILRNDDLDPSASEVATVTDTLHNPIITTLRQQYLETTRREALYASRYGQDHLSVVNLRNQKREIRKNIIDELKQIAAAYKSDYGIAKAREDSIQASLDSTVTGSQTTNKAQVELHQLESVAQTYRALYNNFQARYTDTVQQQSFPTSETSVITRATPPSGASSPKSLRIMAMAAAAGLALGFAVAFMREITDRVFRTASQVESQLKTECMAILPKINIAKLPKINSGAKRAPLNDANNTATSGNKAGSNYRSRIITPNNELLHYVVSSPLSRFAESIRAVKLNADLSAVAKSNKVIGITSSLPNEGKTTVAASLAQLTAHGGARVILVDCDLRRPSVSRELAPHATTGLLEVITGSVNLDDTIWFDPTTRLSFLPMATKSRISHTSEILGSAAMSHIFAQLRETYDYVIVDLPPTVPLVDVRSSSRFVDSYVYVIEWGKTKIDVVKHGLNSARTVYEKLLGVVLTKADLRQLSRYESYHGKQYDQYYAHYGYTD
jgi:polysaccharide biosynthesis transport protein